MNLRSHRLRLGLRQIDVAQYLGITEGAYNRYENGTRSPRPNHAKRLAELFGIRLEEIYKDDGNDKTSHD